MFHLVVIMMIKHSFALSAVSVLMYSFMSFFPLFFFFFFLLALVLDMRLKMSLRELLLSRDL